MTLIFFSLALSLLAGGEIAQPAHAITSNASLPAIAQTADRFVYESSYQNPGFYAQGRYWVFYENYSVCEGQLGCLVYVSSTDGVHFASAINQGKHVTDSDWSIVTDGSNAFYVRYNETSFDSTCGRALLYGTGVLGSDGSIAWQQEQVARGPDPTLAFPNGVVGLDSNGQVWIGYQEDSMSSCHGTGHQTPRIVHTNNQPLPPAPLTSSFMANVSNPIVLQQVGFTATATGGKPTYSFTWDFGDGSPTVVGSNVNHAYNRTGTFTVRLETTDSNFSSQIVDSTETIPVGLLPIGNQQPQLGVPDSTVIKVGTPETFTIIATDPDPGQSVTVTTGSLPSGATFSNSTRQFSWTPTFDQANRTWTISFNATDNGSPMLSVMRQMSIFVAPLWSGDIQLPATPTSAAISANWHVDIATLPNGQVYAAYWANKFYLLGRLFTGSSWGPEEQISLTTDSTDVNSFIFSSGSNLYAIWFDTNSEDLISGSRSQSGNWARFIIAPGEAKSVLGLPGNVNGHRYSLPFTASLNQVDPSNPRFYVFWFNQTNDVIDQWSGTPGGSWIQTPGAFSTQPSLSEYTIGSYHYSSSVNGKNSFGITWIDGSTSPYNLNFGLETVSPITTPATDSSWSPRTNCAASVVTIEQILGNQIGPLGGATESGSIYNPGILAPSPGDAKRWLTAGPNTPLGWNSPGPSCVMTNADGQVVSAFVEILGVQRGFLINEDFSANFDPVNGGRPYSNLKGFNDTTFNIFTPGYSICTSLNTTGCMHTMHLEFDHDWKAAGYCGPGTPCDPYQLAQQSAPIKTLLDFQGFIYWDADHVTDPVHSFSGWEIHPITAWRLSGVSPAFSLSANPSVVTTLPGKSVTSNVTVNTFNLFSGPLQLTAIVTPVDSTTPTATLTRNPVNVPPCNQCAAASTTVNVTARSTSSGPYSVTIKGPAGTPASITITVIVQGFTITATPTSLSIPASSSANATITVTSVGSFTGTVALGATASGCACGFVTSFTPQSVTFTRPEKQNATLTVRAGTVTGTAVINVTGTAPGLSASTILSVADIDFRISSAKQSLTLTSGSSNSTNIGLAGINGFSGIVSLTAVTNSTNLTVLLGSSSVTLAPSGPGSTASVPLTVNGTRTGNYLVTITATSGSLTHQTTIITVAKNTPTINTHLSVNSITVGSSVTESADLSNGFQISGTVSFSVYTASACNGTPVSSQTAGVSSNGAGPVSIAFTASGTFYLQATYNGDANNAAASTVCGSEILTVSKSTATVSLTLPSSTLTVGNSVSVMAIIVGGFQPGGTLLYEYTLGTACPGTSPKTIGTQVAVTNGIVPLSSAQVFNSVGIYQVYVIYNGDQNNLGETSTCRALMVVPLLSSISPITVAAGSTVRFTVNATDPDTSQVVTLTPGDLPAGATFSSAQSFTDGTTSSTFTWTPSTNLAPGVYNITFTATVGSVRTTTQTTIRVVQPVKAPSLPIVSYSIFGIMGFAAVVTAAFLQRRFQTQKRK